MSDLLDRIEKLAGPLRGKTFRAAAEWVISHAKDGGALIETGCYRGIEADGQSTLILALLALETNLAFDSFDIDTQHIEIGQQLLIDAKIPFNRRFNDRISFNCGDSLDAFAEWGGMILFAYLDSFDHDPKNPGPCQRHQLAEVGAIIGRMTAPCAILMDDNIPETGGKTKLAAAFLEDRGWKKKAEGYQLFYVLE